MVHAIDQRNVLDDRHRWSDHEGRDSVDSAEAVGAKAVIPGKEYTVDCSANLPDLVFTLGAGKEKKEFTISGGTWKIEAGQGECLMGIIGLEIPAADGGPFWILGDVFMRDWYSVFDMGKKRMGFAQVVKAANNETITW